DQPVKGEDVLVGGAEPPGLVVPPGMRAVSIKIEMDQIGSGFVLPGSRVDVLSLVKKAEGKESVVRTVEQNLLVLAVDTVGKDLGMTVTLAATVEQAKSLVVAMDKGTLRVVLRPLDDEKKVAPKGSSR